MAIIWIFATSSLQKFLSVLLKYIKLEFLEAVLAVDLYQKIYSTQNHVFAGATVKLTVLELKLLRLGNIHYILQAILFMS